MNIGITVGGYMAAIVLGGLWLNARDAVIEEREGCNADKLQAALEAEKAASDAVISAQRREIERLASEAEKERKAARIAQKAADEARKAPERVKTVIREVPREELAAQCLDLGVPAAVADELRHD